MTVSEVFRRLLGLFRGRKWQSLRMLETGTWISLSLFLILLGFARQTLLGESEELSQRKLSTLQTPTQYPHQIGKGNTLSDALDRVGFAKIDIHAIVEAAKDLRNLNRIAPNVAFRNSSSTFLEFKFSPTEFLSLEKDSQTQQWSATSIVKPVYHRLVSFLGEVDSSLWISAADAGMDPSLISELAEIFAWQVDFAREVQKGDRWRLTVEKQFVDGEAIGWGRITAAEYVNQGQSYQAVLFRSKSSGGKDLGYFAPDGSSLRRMFLKSPISFGRISSKYTGRRLHPILGTYRAHRGVDYAAPRGTPVKAVGAGRVIYVGYRGAGGKTIKVRHNSTYATAYKHLNGYAKGVRRGGKVDQGEVIGYVGSTGRSTGPHLHFEFYENGRYVDPLGKKFPSAAPVPHDLLVQFERLARQSLALLPKWDELQVAQRGPAIHYPYMLARDPFLHEVD